MCTDVRKVPSDCDVDDDDVDDDPIEPVKEKSRVIADLTPRSGSLTWEGRRFGCFLNAYATDNLHDDFLNYG